MLYAIKVGKYPVRVTNTLQVQTAGYDAIFASSRPPYGPHIEAHKNRVQGIENTNLENVRIVDTAAEARLGQIQTRIAEHRKIYFNILTDKFLTFELATLVDFPKVTAGATKEQAQAKLPTGEEAEKMVKHGKGLARLNKNLSRVLK